MDKLFKHTSFSQSLDAFCGARTPPHKVCVLITSEGRIARRTTAAQARYQTRLPRCVTSGRPCSAFPACDARSSCLRRPRWLSLLRTGDRAGQGWQGSCELRCAHSLRLSCKSMLATKLPSVRYARTHRERSQCTPQAFNEDDSEDILLKEWHKVENLRPSRPLQTGSSGECACARVLQGRLAWPSTCGCSTCTPRPACSCVHVLPQRLTHGDEVEVLHDDGWWRMTFMGTRPNAEGGGLEYNVHSALYQVERWVPAEHVRPAWKR